MSIEKRAEQLNNEGVNRERAIEVLKREFPKYHEHYYNDVTSDFPGAGAVDGETKPKSIKRKPPQDVKIIGINMPFGDMVVFMVKWAIAAIPAMIILIFIGLIVGVILAALGLAL